MGLKLTNLYVILSYLLTAVQHAEFGALLFGIH